MRENVIIAYHGASYELGQWPQGYGIWRAGTPQPEPLEWWPPTPEGWSAAWYRFAAIETPGTITAEPAATQAVGPQPGAAGQPGATQAGPTQAASGASADLATAWAPAATAGSGPVHPVSPAPAGPGYAGGPGYAAGPPFAAGPSGPQGGLASPVVADAPPIGTGRARVSTALLALGVVCGVVGLFPNYLGGASLASEPFNLVPHLIYLAAWVGAAVMIFRAGRLARTGALLGLGTSVVTFGLFLADLGTPIAGGASLLGAGLALGIAGWFLCTAGSAVAFQRPAGFPRRPFGREVAVAATLIAAAVGLAVTFAPSWDNYLLRVASGASLKVTAGYAFNNPAPVIAGDVAVMVALVAVVVVAVLWRPGRLGWALAAGALIPMAAQAISAPIQVGEPTSPASFGYSSAAASQAGLTISNGLTGWFWAYCAFLVAAIIGCVWLAVSREQTALRPGALGRAGYTGPVPFGGSGPVAYTGAGPAAWPGAAPAGYPGASPAAHPRAETTGWPSPEPAAFPDASTAAYPAAESADPGFPPPGDAGAGPGDSPAE